MFNTTIKRNKLDSTKNLLFEFTGSLGGDTAIITPIGSIEFSNGVSSASISFLNPTNHASGMSDSLQRLISGDAYLNTDQGITITTGSSPAGQITISSVQTAPNGSDHQAQFNNNDSLFIAGNGTSDATRSDIFLVNDQSAMAGSGSIGADTFLHIGTYSVSRNTATFGGNVMVSGTLDITNRWNSYTPEIDDTTTNPALPTTKWLQGKYCKKDKELSLLFNFSYRVSTGIANGTGAYLVHMPPGFTIDTSTAPVGIPASIFLDGVPVGTGLICADSILASICHMSATVLR